MAPAPGIWAFWAALRGPAAVPQLSLFTKFLTGSAVAECTFVSVHTCYFSRNPAIFGGIQA